MAFSQRLSAPTAEDEEPKEASAQVSSDSAAAEAYDARREQEREERERARAREQEEMAKRRQAAFEARRRAEDEERRRREYEAEKARQETIARSKREAARRAMGASDGAGFGGGGRGGAGRPGGGFGSRGGGAAFAWKKSSAPGKGAGNGGRRPDLPSHDDCEMGISAMISRTQNGMKEGLAHLGLPSFPLVFVPGQELRLCGHNLREEINEMIHAWMTDEKDYFYDCLVEIKKACENPLLTEEDMTYIDRKDEWKQFTGLDGKPMYARRGADEPEAQQQEKHRQQQQAEEEEEDDEVIDVTPAGERIPPAAAPATPPGMDRAALPKPAPIEEDYYELLGVDPSASLNEIRTKFRELVIKHHPEKGGDVKRFQRMNKAYSVLSDNVRRQEFDASLAAATSAPSGTPMLRRGGGGYPANG